MSAPITGQTITFEQISETLRTQYSDAEKRLQDSNKTQVDPMRLNKTRSPLITIFALVLKTNLCLLRLKCRFQIRQRHYSKDERCPPDNDFG
ncbi:putative cell invasion type III effector protein [Escherichia coli]|uniref:Putative cell invasion type III effector protein n=1 Tax=Escherichia coli TaxID=562 RepID=A0A376MLC6_ECOLX|nr:putative cell invasion type III effector protein [Escherichia coli]